MVSLAPHCWWHEYDIPNNCNNWRVQLFRKFTTATSGIRRGEPIYWQLIQKPHSNSSNFWTAHLRGSACCSSLYEDFGYGYSSKGETKYEVCHSFSPRPHKSDKELLLFGGRNVVYEERIRDCNMTAAATAPAWYDRTTPRLLTPARSTHNSLLVATSSTYFYSGLPFWVKDIHRPTVTTNSKHISKSWSAITHGHGYGTWQHVCF